MAREMQFGPLVLVFTDEFEFRWNDRKSGARTNGAFWHPVAPSGFHALGSVGVNNHDDINQKEASLCVKAAPGQHNAICFPESYEPIWNDSGSGASLDGSCWRPIPPEGYVALGDVFVRGYAKPHPHDIVCIRKDLVVRAQIGNEIWADHGSGARADFDSFAIVTPSVETNSEKGCFAPNTFVAKNSYQKPTDAPVINCLHLPFPVEQLQDPSVPKLTSFSMPEAYSGKTVDRIVTVPFTAIKDDAYSLHWKVKNSPFYRLERQISYHRELFNHNDTSEPQTFSKTVTTGVTVEQSQTFSVTTGISVTAESGVSFLGTGGKVSATVSVELGWERSTGVSELKQDSVLKQLVTPVSKAACLWAISYNLLLVREDNTYTGQQLSFEADAFYESEYPQ